jgi:hypothetical protein
MAIAAFEIRRIYRMMTLDARDGLVLVCFIDYRSIALGDRIQPPSAGVVRIQNAAIHVIRRGHFRIENG